MKVVLYARTSAARKSGDEISVDEQIRQMTAYCQQHSHEIVAAYQDVGCSESCDERSGFHEMVTAIESGSIDVEAILFLTTSRFFRNVIDAGVWKRRMKKLGVRVIAITQETSNPDTPTTNLLETIFAAIDQHESKMLGFHVGRAVYHYNDSLEDEYSDSEVIIPDKEITIKLPYHLCGTLQFKVQSEQGFTRKGLFDSIERVYEQHACRVDEFLSSNASRACFGTKDSQYGILGLELEDFYLQGVYYDSEEKLARVDVQTD